MSNTTSLLSEKVALPCCTVCSSQRLQYAFSQHGYRIVRCTDCQLMFTNPQPSDAELGEIYGRDYFLGSGEEHGKQHVADMKRATAREYLGQLLRYRGSHGGRLLEVGCGSGDFLGEAEAVGYHVTGVEYSEDACANARRRIQRGDVLCGEVQDQNLEEGTFDVCIMNDVIEHVRQPRQTLEHLHRLLKPGGIILIATPSADSWSARLLGRNWMEFKPEHLTYFDTQTMQTALFSSGFREIICGPGYKLLSLDYVARHFEKFTVPFFTPLLSVMRRCLPKSIADKPHRVVASGMLVMARKAPQPQRQSLSIILPAYNEVATFEEVANAVLNKTIAGLDIEVVIVESNSTDGTRDLALKFKDHPRVRLVLEDKPRGKGHAVRAGLKAATGDFILIQDADLEYDLEDYDMLVEPLIHGRESFVLGARHGGGAWKMRQFNGQPLLSTLLNSAHWFFTTLLNVLYGQRLKDPFTMFKVFRRDCLHGLRFECNRFDFDYELLIKLLRRGCKPIEMPVNYRSRSFKEGKKVTMFGDPITWLVALFKFRFQRVDPLSQIETERTEQAAAARQQSTAPTPGMSLKTI